MTQPHTPLVDEASLTGWIKVHLHMTDVIQLLKEGNSVSIQPKGTSMYPLFEEKKQDKLTIIPIEEIGGISGTRVGDILLYRSEFFGGLTVHRLVKKRKDGLYFCGDNQQRVEGPLAPEMVYGKVTEIVRTTKTISVEKVSYRFYSFVWTHTIWLRKIFRPPVTAIHKLINKNLKH